MQNSFQYSIQHFLVQQFFVFGAVYAIGISLIISFIVFLKSYSNSSEKNRSMMLVYALISTILMVIAVKLAEFFYYNPRPFIVHHFTPIIPFTVDNGFPSGHTVFSAGLAAIASPYAKKFFSIVLWLIVIWVAFSRIYLGVHHTIDVIGSIVIAVLVSLLAFHLSKIFSRKFLGKV
jgi:undecaprenyl-diphosphatase